MSQDNVELVRKVLALTPDLVAPESLQAADREYGGLLDEDFELRWPATWPEGEQVFRGRKGAADIAEMLSGSWAEWRIEPEQFIDAGDRVVVFVRVRARGAESGAEVEFERGQVWTVRDGRAISMDVHNDRAAAVAAAGLQA